MEVIFEVGVAGAKSASSRGDICLVVDVLRASSTIITALAYGIQSVKPVATLADCVGKLTAGEINGRKIACCDFCNSPIEIMHAKPQANTLVLYSSNGTKCIHEAIKGSPLVLIASLLNMRIVAKAAYIKAESLNKSISIILAGNNGKLEDDDWLAGSYIAQEMPNVEYVGKIKPMKLQNFDEQFRNSNAAKRLEKIGYENDINFCLQKNTIDIVPIYDQKTGRIIISNI